MTKRRERRPTGHKSPTPARGGDAPRKIATASSGGTAVTATGPIAENAAGRRRPTRTSAPARVAVPEWTWFLILVLGLGALLVACRGALFGVAVSDDYSFLYRQRFQRPLDFFDTMGAAFYWRPLSRQVYFSIVAPWQLSSPVGVTVIHFAILAALSFLLYRVARHGFSPPVAAAIAAFPLIAEPARVLVVWASGAQHLLASLFVVLALHEALEGRRLTAGLAALAAVFSHELGVLVLPLLPLIEWFRSRNQRQTLLWAAAAGVVGVVWGIGYTIAFRHGVTLPRGEHGHYPIAQVPSMLVRAVAGALNLEDLGAARDDLWIAYGVMLAVVPIALLDRGVRERVRGRLGVVALAFAWFAIAAFPLLLVTDWNAWRAWIPTLGFGLGATALLGLVSPWLAGAFVALRLTALLLAPIAPAIADAIPQTTDSHLSFQRLTRLQRVVESSRRELKARQPRLPHRAQIRYWWMPRLTEFGFQGPHAVRVWYGDSTLVWDKFGGNEGYNRHSDALIEYLNDTAWPAQVDQVELLDYIRRGHDLMTQNRWLEADTIFAQVIALHHSDQGGLLASIVQNRARVAFNLHLFERADSLNQVSMRLDVADPDPWALRARLALVANDIDGAREALRTCLSIDPTNGEGQQIMRMVEHAGP